MDPHGGRVRTLPAGSGAGWSQTRSTEASGTTEIARPNASRPVQQVALATGPVQQVALATGPLLDPTPPPKLNPKGAAAVIATAATGSASLGRSNRRPILASECLRDDLAPREPLLREGQLFLAATGTLLLGTAGVTEYLGMPWPTVTWVAILGATQLVASMIRSYPVRGWFVLLSALGGLVPVILHTVGPMRVTEVLVRSLLLAALATTMWLRSTYRTSRLVRPILAVLLSAIFGVVLHGLRVPVPFERALAAVTAAVAVSAALGFMSSASTGAGRPIGTCALVLAGLSPALVGWWTAGFYLTQVPLAVVAACGAASSSLGAFMILADRIWPVERARAERTPIGLQGIDAQ